MEFEHEWRELEHWSVLREG